MIRAEEQNTVREWRTTRLEVLRLALVCSLSDAGALITILVRVVLGRPAEHG